MNKRLDEALTRVKALPDEQQAEVADLLFDFLERGRDIYLTPEQVAEIERNLADSEPYASEAEVRALFQRLTKRSFGTRHVCLDISKQFTAT
jgi:hypothetical protein